MLEILVVMAVIIFVIMAKHGKGRRYPPLRVLPYSVSAAAGTLANGAVATATVANTVDQRMWFMSQECTWGIRDFTAGEGPIVVGVAHSDYTAAEIEECLEAQAAWDSGNLVAREQARRKVRTVGTFAVASANETLNDGRPIKTKLNWYTQLGETLDIFIWNKSGATLTTGGIVVVDGRVYANNR